jgi:hypothetical protein
MLLHGKTTVEHGSIDGIYPTRSTGSPPQERTIAFSRLTSHDRVVRELVQ